MNKEYSIEAAIAAAANEGNVNFRQKSNGGLDSYDELSRFRADEEGMYQKKSAVMKEGVAAKLPREKAQVK